MELPNKLEKAFYDDDRCYIYKYLEMLDNEIFSTKPNNIFLGYSPKETKRLNYLLELEDSIQRKIRDITKVIKAK